MTDQQTTNRRPVEQLAAGQHISDADGVHEVVHALSYRNGDGRPWMALTLRPLHVGQPWIARWQHGAAVHLATDEEIREYADMARRQAVADALHKLADDIVQKRLPLPSYTVFFSAGVLESRADLDRWAAYIGGEVRGGKPGDPIPAVTVDRPVAGRLSLNMHAQCQPEPEPEACPCLDQPEPVEAPPADPEPEHYHAAGAGNEPGACAAVCACGVTFAGFDSIAEAVVELDKHIANPEPEQEWLFTFGSGQQHDGRFVRITGTHESARARMVEVFGTAWCDQYDWAKFDAYGLPATLTELPEAEWPTRASDAQAGR